MGEGPLSIDPKRPKKRNPRPTAMITAPEITRRVRLRRGRMAASSRRAAMIGTREARTAGTMADTIVTTRPDANPTMTVRG